MGRASQASPKHDTIDPAQAWHDPHCRWAKLVRTSTRAVLGSRTLAQRTRPTWHGCPAAPRVRVRRRLGRAQPARWRRQWGDRGQAVGMAAAGIEGGRARGEARARGRRGGRGTRCSRAGWGEGEKGGGGQAGTLMTIGPMSARWVGPGMTRENLAIFLPLKALKIAKEFKKSRLFLYK